MSHDGRPNGKPKPKRFLCVCEGGNVRSATLAYVLHDKHGQEAIPVGLRWASPATLETLCEWADYVMLLEGWMQERIPARWGAKIRVFDVGPDIWGLSLNPQLHKMVADVAADWASRAFVI